MYIARSVASGIRLRRTYTHYHQMPRLSGEAQKFYFAAYSEKEYFDRNDDNDKFHDREMPTNFDDDNVQERGDELDNGDLLDGSRDGDSDDSLGSDDDSDEEELQESEDDSDKEELQESDDASDYDDIPTSDDSPPAPSFHHRPDHDVESFFWVLLATLLRARPKKWKPDPHRKFFWNAYDMFLRHSVEAGKVDDSRAELLSYEADDFKKALHPKLQDLAPMLGKMAQQVYPEYGFMDPPPALDHLHEAMRRLLLEQIVQMQNAKNPIPLTAGSLRPLRMKKPIRKRVEQPDFGGTSAAGDTPSTRGTKRKSGNQKKGGLKKKVKRTYGDKDGRLRHVDA